MISNLLKIKPTLWINNMKSDYFMDRIKGKLLMQQTIDSYIWAIKDFRKKESIKIRFQNSIKVFQTSKLKIQGIL